MAPICSPLLAKYSSLIFFDALRFVHFYFSPSGAKGFCIYGGPELCESLGAQVCTMVCQVVVFVPSVAFNVFKGNGGALVVRFFSYGFEVFGEFHVGAGFPDSLCDVGGKFGVVADDKVASVSVADVVDVLECFRDGCEFGCIVGPFMCP